LRPRSSSTISSWRYSKRLPSYIFDSVKSDSFSSLIVAEKG